MELDTHLIGIRIMQHRKSLGMTQEELAEKVGYSKNHLSSIERGLNIPTTQFLVKLCNVLGESPDYYLVGTLSEKGNELLDLIKMLPEEDKEIVCLVLKTYLGHKRQKHDT